MSVDVIVKVGRFFVAKIEQDELTLGFGYRAMRFNWTDAVGIVEAARKAFPEEIHFSINRCERPYETIETLNNEPFIIVVGRRYLAGIIGGHVRTSFALHDAKRQGRHAAERQARLVRIVTKKTRFYVAHESTPFLEVTDGAATPDDTGIE